jgi:hypothetical protein
LSIDFGINNERQDCKMGMVCGRGLVCGVNGGDEDEGIGWMSFIYIEEIE